MTRRLSNLVAFVALLGLLAWAGRNLLFGVFMLYDDEGYVLLSLRDFGNTGGLYDIVYSQYGPFFYLTGDLLRKIVGFAWTNEAGRWLTLIHWLLTSILCGAVVWRHTRTLPLTLCATAVSFGFLWVNVAEPGHPGSLLALLVAIVAWLGSDRSALDDRRLPWLLGALGAAVTLTKINVGGFLILGTGVLLAIECAPAKLRRQTMALAAVAAVALPFALMGRLLHERWVWNFAILSACASTAAILAADRALPSRDQMSGHPFSRGPLRDFCLAGALATAVVLSWAILRGSTWNGLLTGVLLGPLRHPSIYTFDFRQLPGTPFLSPILLIVAFLYWRNSHTQGRMVIILAALRLCACLALPLLLLPEVANRIGSISLCYLLPLAPLLALPLRNAPDAGDRGRAWLAVLLAFQALHAFPVAGSQIQWGTFLWVPLVLSAGGDASRFLAKRNLNHGLHAVSLLLTAALATNLVRLGRDYQNSGFPLGLPGAEHIVIEGDHSPIMRSLVATARAEGDMLATLPGCYSFNLWSGLPTPTRRNVTHWFSLLPGEDQSDIIAALRSAKKPILIVQHNVLSALVSQGFRAQGPLMEYLREDFERLVSEGGYTLWVRRGLDARPRRLACLWTPHPKTGEARLALELPRNLAARVERVEILQPDKADPVLATSTLDIAKEAAWQALDRRGLPAGPERSVDDQAASDDGCLLFPVADAARLHERSRLTVRLVGGAGEELGLLPLVGPKGLPERMRDITAAPRPTAD